MRRAAVVLVIACLGAVAAPAGADEVAEAQARVDRVQREVDRLRSEYSVLAQQARRAEGEASTARVRIVGLQRSIDEAHTVLAEARRMVEARARLAYMGDVMGNVDAALRIRDYAQIDAYLPYVTRPLEEDRRTAEVYRHRLQALRSLEEDLVAAKDDAVRTASDLGELEARLTANLDAQQKTLAAARQALEAAQKAKQERERAASAAASAAAASAASSSRSRLAPGTVLRGPQRGSGPGPEAGIPDPIDVPPAPRVLPNGVELGPAAGVPEGMTATGIKLSGVASWYGPGFHGWTTASGETYDQYGFSAAHKDLAFGTVLLVSFRDRSVLLRVNDRGPYVDDRFLDLSKGAADALGFSGVGYLDAEILVPS